jgi:hypothetical protein
MTYQNIWNPANLDCSPTTASSTKLSNPKKIVIVSKKTLMLLLRFLFKNPRLLFALATMLLACCVHFKSDWRVIPRYFAEETDSAYITTTSTQNKTYYVLQDCSPYSCSSYNNIDTYRPKNQTISSIYIQTSLCIRWSLAVAHAWE